MSTTLPPPPSCPGPPPAPPPIAALKEPAPLSSKLSPAALRGVSNTTTVSLPPEQALGEAAQRAARFQPSLAQGAWSIFCSHVPPARLQEGPQCGLVALSLAAATRGLTCTPGEVQELAIKRGFSLQGEMFSASDMADLSKELVGGGEVMTINLVHDAVWLVNVLAQGRQLLAPYDCAANHSPCLEGGKKAHWALVCGFAWKAEECKGTPLDLAPGWFWRDEVPDPSELMGEVMLLARQSKSLVLGLWDREELVQSCLNLKAINPKRGEECKYVIPEGGIEAGLAGKMVLLHPLKRSN